MAGYELNPHMNSFSLGTNCNFTSNFYCIRLLWVPLTHDDHVSVVGDGGEGGGLGADFAPVPARRLLREAREGDLPVAAALLESVRQSHFGSRFAFWHFNLQIEMQIGAQMSRTVIPYLKPILNTSILKSKMQIEMK